MNRREFLKGALTTGVVVVLGKVCFEDSNVVRVSDDTETEPDYRLTFQQTQSYHWGGWNGQWVHQHDGADLLWVSFCDDGHAAVLGWHKCPPARASIHGRYLRASNLVRRELNRIHWAERLVAASFVVPQWTMIEMGILPEEAFHEQT